MYDIRPIAISDLLLDPANARFPQEQPNQPAAMLALARLEGRALLKQAEDIVKNGMDPLALPGVVEKSDDPGRFLVIEGNRRVLALKALDNPALVSPALTTAGKRQLEAFAKEFAEQPIISINCVVADESELAHWVTLRHTGANDGVGLVTWGTREQDRWRRRHQRDQANPAGVILDFVERFGGLSEQAKKSKRRVFTNVGRVISNRENRRRLGIDFGENREVVMLYPAAEVAKSLTRVVDDLLTGMIRVKDIYDLEQQTAYVKSFGQGDLPDPKTKLDKPRPLSAESGGDQKGKPRPKRKPKPRKATDRETLIPSSFRPDIGSTRMQRIHGELSALNLESYSNAVAVTLRVYVELAIDTYIERRELMTESELRNAPLAKKLKAAADKLHCDKKISVQLRQTIEHVADKQGVLAASVPTFHRYIHNPFTHPKPFDLKVSWDELQPFMEALWKDMS